MRLICPNCGAQYEVPTNVIPEGGRDVQCSNCGHTWFQAHPDDDPQLTQELDRPLQDEDRQPEPEDAPEAAQPAAEFAEAFETDDEGEAPVADAAPELQPAPQPAPEPQPRRRPRRELDPSVAEVLREEAEREARRRASEAGSLETQAELGLTDPSTPDDERRTREAPERMGPMRGEDNTESFSFAEEPPAATAPEPDPAPRAAPAPETGAAAAAASSRRELLPDIEEINQTLRASSERRSMETPQGRAAFEEEDAAESRGFGRGFRMVIALAVVAVALYLLAPTIAEFVPGSTPLLDAYVGQIDTARLWLDGQVGALVQQFGGE